jgi:hypothetical protein
MTVFELQLFEHRYTVERAKCDHLGTEENWLHYPNDNNIRINSIPTILLF